MKTIDTAKIFKIPKQNVNYWLHHPIIVKRKRETKLIRPKINIIKYNHKMGQRQTDKFMFNKKSYE